MNATTTPTTLKTLTDKAIELQNIRAKIAEQEKTLKHLEDQEKYLSCTCIPELMFEEGLSSFTNEAGMTVKPITRMFGSLKAGHREAAEPLLIENGMAAILIKTVAVKDNMDDNGKARLADMAEIVLKDHIDEDDLEVSIECHHAKLKSALKELIASNVTVTVCKLLKFYKDDKNLIAKTFFPEIYDKETETYSATEFPGIDKELQLGQILEKVFGVYQVTETEIKEKK